ncbi:TonB-dependent receptor [Scytonema sp. UIC 10036]|nr:TonB-dependent receptor [Scytonema sp. UIC 10036]
MVELFDSDEGLIFSFTAVASSSQTPPQEQPASEKQPNTITIPSYARTDATIFYRKANYQVGLSFKNLLDIKYYDSQGFLLSPGAPFTVLGTVSVKF